jgi:hypothetical protein
MSPKLNICVFFPLPEKKHKNAGYARGNFDTFGAASGPGARAGNFQIFPERAVMSLRLVRDALAAHTRTGTIM